MLVDSDERSLVSVKVIDSISPIEGADRIEVAHIGGWKVVVGKGEFRAGNSVWYFEVDTALPVDVQPFSFLRERGTKVIDGREYHILRTIRLKGVYSQGLIMHPFATPSLDFKFDEGTGFLGLRKWEQDLPVDRGSIIGRFPTDLIAKTDSERVQNLTPDQWTEIKKHSWYATEKLDGTSATIVLGQAGILHVCSRNYEVNVDSGGIYAELLEDETVLAIVHELNPGEGIQGEIVGPGIQGNPLNLKERTFFPFIVTNSDGTPNHNWDTTAGYYAFDYSVPVYESLVLPDTIEEAVEQANGIKSLMSPGRLAEGIVWHLEDVDGGLECLGGRSTFKVISNKYLERNAK